MLLWTLIACADRLDHTGLDSVDTGSSQVDPGSDWVWSPLETAAGWSGAERGYGTGLGFGDFDGDGDLDLVASYGNDMEPGPIRIFENRGGALEEGAAWSSAGDHYYAHLAVGDLNGDGLPDLAVSRFLGDGRFAEPGGVQVFLNEGGELGDRPAWEASGFYSFSCALGDVDRDGDLDLVAAVGEAYYNEPDVSRVWLNDGGGGFGDAPAWTTEAPRHSFDAAWLDTDRDGWLDLAFANSGSGHTIYLNDGAGALQPEPSWTAPGDDSDFEGNTLDWGDVDGDGWLDLAISDNDQLGGIGAVRLWCGPEPTLCWQSADGVAYPSAVSLEDVDGDGRLDLAAGSWWGAARIFLQRPDPGGGWALEPEPSWIGATDDLVIEAFAWADVDGSDEETAQISGQGLVEIPGRGRVLSVTGGVAGDGWISGSGTIEATWVAPRARDLALSDWEDSHGERLYRRTP